MAIIKGQKVNTIRDDSGEVFELTPVNTETLADQITDCDVNIKISQDIVSTHQARILAFIEKKEFLTAQLNKEVDKTPSDFV